jgi:tetrahydromethanopterin S-methyltransferase subunit H
MFKFKTPQKVFDIGEVKIGGQPGQNPPVLIGSIFHHKHKILLDERKGEIAREKAKALISQQEEFSAKSGVPCMLDVVGATSDAMKKLIDFTCEATDVPILVDSPDSEVKIAGIMHAKEIGLETRMVYNSLTQQSAKDEYEAIQNSGVKSAILLAYRGGFMTSADRVKTVEQFLPKTKKAGISKPLIDTLVIDLPSLGLASKAQLDIKRKLGLPCGCGAHNAFSTWRGLKEKMGNEAVIPSSVTINDIPIVLGADFILYGPVEECKYVFPSVYAIYTAYKSLARTKELIEL